MKPPFSGPLKLTHECVSMGNQFNSHRVFIVDPQGKEVVETGDYITQVFPECPSVPNAFPTFMDNEPPPYSDKSRFILRALNAALQP